MGLSTVTLCIMVIGSLLTVVFIVLLLISNKYEYLIKPLSSKEYRFPYLYGVGFFLLDLFHYKFGTKSELKRKQKVAILYGNKYSSYYLKVIAAQRITMSFLVLILGLILYGFTEDISILLIFAVFTGTAFYYFGDVPSRRINKRSEEIMMEFPDVVSKLALLTNAGMILKEAWKKVAYTGESVIYQEMRMAIEEMDNGMSETDAYDNFGMRCVVPEVRKFTSTIIQGTVKGNRELVHMLKEQSREIWGVKQQYVKQQGAKAASKLLIPIMIMFLGIIMMVVVPIFTNLGI